MFDDLIIDKKEKKKEKRTIEQENQEDEDEDIFINYYGNIQDEDLEGLNMPFTV